MLIDENDDENICMKYKVVLIIMTIIAFFWFIIVLYTTWRFIKVFGFTNKWLMMFFLLLNLSVLARMGNFIVELDSRYKRHWKAPPNWIDSTLTFLNIMFFSSAVLFNLFHWWYHIVEINHYLNVTASKNKKITVILIMCQTINYLTYGAIIIFTWVDKDIDQNAYNNIFYIYDAIVSLTYLIVSITFTWAGIIFYK